MRRMYNRFWDWVFHPSIRRDPEVRGKAYLYRYPSPGSIFKEDGPEDYKTPFQQSKYNVRYINPTSNQVAEQRSETIVPGLAIDPIRKLVLLNFLKESDKDNQTAITEARTKFKAAYGFEVENQIYQNDLRLKIPQINDREAIHKYVEENFSKWSQVRKSDELYGTEEEVQHPNIVQYQSLDLYDDPHFQQSRIENAYNIDKIARMRAQTVENEGGLESREGNRNYWKPLDDSNDPQNIKKVQQKIGDPNPLSFEIREGKIKFEFDKDGNVVDIERVIDTK